MLITTKKHHLRKATKHPLTHLGSAFNCQAMISSRVQISIRITWMSTKLGILYTVWGNALRCPIPWIVQGRINTVRWIEILPINGIQLTQCEENTQYWTKQCHRLQTVTGWWMLNQEYLLRSIRLELNIPCGDRQWLYREIIVNIHAFFWKIWLKHGLLIASKVGSSSNILNKWFLHNFDTIFQWKKF